MIPSITFLYGTIGRPIVLSGFSSGKIFLISFHILSGMRVIVLTYFLLLNNIRYDKKQTRYIPIYFWDRLLDYYSNIEYYDIITNKNKI